VSTFTSATLNPSSSIPVVICGTVCGRPVLIRMCPAGVVMRYVDRSYVPTQ
jgi:hypothetical protein